MFASVESPVGTPACRPEATQAALTPTKISAKLEPATQKKGIEAWPATARASSVLPVPGAEVAVPC